MDKKGNQKIYYTAAERARARNNRDKYKGYLLQYIEEHLTPTPRAGKYHYTCPYEKCDTGTKGKGTGAFTYYPNTDRYYCHACETGGDIYDLMQQLEPERENAPDPIGAYLLAERRYKGQEPPPRVKATPPDPPAQQQGQPTASTGGKTIWQRQFDIEMSCPAWHSKEGRAYLTARGLTGETSLQFDLKHDTSEGKNVLIIPYKGDADYFYNSRNMKPDAQVKYYKHGRQTRLFNQDALYTQGQGYLFITEGEIDAMSITQAGGQAIALGSTGGADLLIRVLAEQPTQKHLILALDQDAAGQGATDKASEGLARLGIPHSTYHIGGAYHDANDLLVKGGQQALAEEIHKAIEQAQQAPAIPTHNTDTQQATSQDTSTTQAGGISTPSASNPQPDNIETYLAEAFDKENQEYQQYEGLKTQITAIDKAMGSVYPDLYVVGANPGIGKTTLMLQLAANFAKQDKHILFFSLEQSKRALVSKGISREAILTGLANPPTAKQIRQGDRSAAAIKGREAYSRYAKRLNIIDCNFSVTLDNIIDYARQYMEANQVKPIIFIDYLQALSAGSSKQGYRESVDINMKGLKAFQEAHGLIVFLVSSYNRDNYTSTADYTSFKESGGIDYTGSVIWGLQLTKITDDDFKKIPASRVTERREKISQALDQANRRITLSCIKNRDGDTFSCDMIFIKAHDLFTDA